MIINSEQTPIEDVMRLVNIVSALRQDVFVSGTDYGTIPGTNDKPVLLLPGMEKLMRALHLRAEYVLKTQVEDFDKPLFFYRYECRLIDYNNGECISTAIGSANSHESKWRWREAKRVCPNCGKGTINKSKFPPKNNPNAAPGWYCHAKAGGCGAEYPANDPAIMGQQVGRVENPDICDQINTIDKIAQKRSLSSAIKSAANVSMFFTVDIEDFVPFETSGRTVDMSTGEIVEGKVVTPAPTPEPPAPLREVKKDSRPAAVHVDENGEVVIDGVPERQTIGNALDAAGLTSANEGEPVPDALKPVLRTEAEKQGYQHVMKTPALKTALSIKNAADFDNMVAALKLEDKAVDTFDNLLGSLYERAGMKYEKAS